MKKILKFELEEEKLDGAFQPFCWIVGLQHQPQRVCQF